MFKEGQSINIEGEEKQDLPPPIQLIFENSVKDIKKYTGLELKTSELVRLRHIAIEASEQLEKQQPSVGWGYNLVRETSARFLFENYGIDVNPMDWWKFFGGDKKSKEDKKSGLEASRMRCLRGN